MLQSSYSPGKSLTASTSAKRKSIKKINKEGGPVSPSGKISFNQRANYSRLNQNYTISESENPEEHQ